MEEKDKLIIRKIIIDIVLLATVGFPILFFYLWGKPYERGFFCDDESIRHPFHESTVTSTMLYFIGLGMPIILIVFSEFMNFKGKKNVKWRTFKTYKIPPWVWTSYQIIGVFGFGVACQQLATDIAKYTVGRLRPHFYTVCQPDIDCSLEKYRWQYITEFKCLGSDDHLLKEMRLSFPSGHSSFSTFTMIYISVYMQRRFLWTGSKLLRHGIQYCFLMLAWYTTLSRISDYKHHWSDVLGGSLIGIVSAILVFGCISNLWKESTWKSIEPDAESGDQMHTTGNANGSTVAPV